MVWMLYSTRRTPASPAVYLAGSPTETRPDSDTPALSVPSSSRAPSQPPEGRDFDWEDYKSTTTWPGQVIADLLLVEVSKATWRIPWRLYWPGFGPGFLTSTPRSWRLCCATCQFLTIQVNLLAWLWRRQWRWVTRCNIKHVGYILGYIQWYISVNKLLYSMKYNMPAI